MYRTRRPLLAAVLVLVVLVLAVPVLLLVWRSLAEKTFNPGGVIAGTLAVVGLPMLAAGLYPLIGVPPGAFARQGFGVLLRPPYLYAVVGVLLLACAGLAAA